MTIEADNSALQELISRHEGKKLDMYKDSEGIWTIGIGHNLQDRGISDAVCTLLFQEDVALAISDCEKFTWYRDLDEVRQAVIIDMMFNMGFTRFLGFTKTIDFIKNGLYLSASVEMLDSRWADQVGNRANRLSKMMETGEWQ